ncbi:MAG: phosphotransferase family protein [Proteobacteria bacterium]|nr:phosphotransferase family protein [Pseudomonadota bacterium]
MKAADQAVTIRKGEELDEKKVEMFLKDSIPGLSGDIEVLQFPGGYSNLTYCLRVGERELVLRRPPFGSKVKSAHDMGREYRVLKALKPYFPYCPAPLAYTEDTSVLGCPFYVMERIKGIILRKTLPEGMTLTSEDMNVMCHSLISVHAELHAVDYKAAGLDNLGNPEGYVTRQVEGWSKRFRASHTADAPDYENIMRWLHEKMPGESSCHAIIHNDYKFDNVILDPSNPTRIIGVLDWEMTTLGDPLMDLGASLAYWIEKNDPSDLRAVKMMITDHDGALTRKEILEVYAEKTGRAIDNFDFYYCYGLFRLAVIVQQIYYRFYHGLTQDKRFGELIHLVNVLEKTARNVIDRSQL